MPHLARCRDGLGVEHRLTAARTTVHFLSGERHWSEFRLCRRTIDERSSVVEHLYRCSTEDIFVHEAKKREERREQKEI